MRIIVITGPKGSRKNTMACQLAECHLGKCLHVGNVEEEPFSIMSIASKALTSKQGYRNVVLENVKDMNMVLTQVVLLPGILNYIITTEAKPESFKRFNQWIELILDARHDFLVGEERNNFIESKDRAADAYARACEVSDNIGSTFNKTQDTKFVKNSERAIKDLSSMYDDNPEIENYFKSLIEEAYAAPEKPKYYKEKMSKFKQGGCSACSLVCMGKACLSIYGQCIDDQKNLVFKLVESL